VDPFRSCRTFHSNLYCKYTLTRSLIASRFLVSSPFPNGRHPAHCRSGDLDFAGTCCPKSACQLACTPWWVLVVDTLRPHGSLAAIVQPSASSQYCGKTRGRSPPAWATQWRLPLCAPHACLQPTIPIHTDAIIPHLFAAAMVAELPRCLGRSIPAIGTWPAALWCRGRPYPRVWRRAQRRPGSGCGTPNRWCTA